MITTFVAPLIVTDTYYAPAGNTSGSDTRLLPRRTGPGPKTQSTKHVSLRMPGSGSSGIEEVAPLAIHANDGSSSAILFRSQRTFTVWRYGVGHSQLLLRAVPDSGNTLCLDLLFEGVRAMQLVTHYKTLELHTASDSESQQMLEFSELSPPWRERYRVVSLHSRSGSGLVLCSRISALRGGEDPVGLPEGPEGREVIWSMRLQS
ncbi:hypothetical protein [Streptomyces bugieae]|uniref:Uncharacterized protein n=1 Tax=Streptomyces bugieae TaxID=3098223 RepID=A0ABU7NUF9_9ACTN|nr:hypothetical protein [Streptomyces sp. DSM 41528]